MDKFGLGEITLAGSVFDKTKYRIPQALQFCYPNIFIAYMSKAKDRH
jgi:hypothetical protein